MEHQRNTSCRRMFAVLLVLPLLAGCLFIEGGGMTDEEEAGLKVYREYQADPAAATARFLEEWRAGAPRQSQGEARARWIAIAGLLSNRKQGPTKEFTAFLVDSLEEAKPAIAVQAARELRIVAGVDVVNALLDTSASITVDATVREAAALALIEKIDMRMFSATEPDEEVLLDRLTSACAAPQRTTQLIALCERAEQAMARHVEQRKMAVPQPV